MTKRLWARWSHRGKLIAQRNLPRSRRHRIKGELSIGIWFRAVVNVKRNAVTPVRHRLLIISPKLDVVIRLNFFTNAQHAMHMAPRLEHQMEIRWIWVERHLHEAEFRMRREDKIGIRFW